jgi:hypothetical protein
VVHFRRAPPGQFWRALKRTRKEPVLKNAITYVGLDAHQKDIYVAMRVGHERVPVRWQLANEQQAILRLVRMLEREALARPVPL